MSVESVMRRYQTRPTTPEPVAAVPWDETMKRQTAWRVKP